MKRIRNPAVKDIEAATSMLELIQYYLDPKNAALQAAYHSFSSEHHAAAAKRASELFGRDSVSAADLFNRKLHIVPHLPEDLVERALGECIEKDAILYVYPNLNRALYKRLLERYAAMHSFEKTRGLCLRSSVAAGKNVRQLQLMIHGAKSFAGLKLIKDKNCSILYNNLVAEFALDDEYVAVIGEIDAFIIADIHADYCDEAGVFTGVSRSGFYVVRDEKAKTTLKLEKPENVDAMLLGKREPLLAEPEKRDDGTTYAPKISFKLTSGTQADGQKFNRQGARQVMDFAKPDALLAAQMEKYHVKAVGPASNVEYAIPNPAIVKSKNGKDVSENYFLSRTECSLLVTMSAWLFGSETVEFPDPQNPKGPKTRFTFAKIGAKFYPAKISIVRDNVSDDAHADPIAAANRDLELDDADDVADAMMSGDAAGTDTPMS